jgi:hypothetical protein
MRTVLLTDGRILVPVPRGYEIARVGVECTCGEGIDLECARHFPLTRHMSGYQPAKEATE